MAALQPNSKFNFANASVLVVDESQIGQEVSLTILSSYGFRAITRSTSLQNATEHLRFKPFDLVLIDPYAFGEASYKFIKWLREDTNNPNTCVPVIVTAAYTSMRTVAAARECGADYIIAKPFSCGGFLDRLLFVASKAGHRSELAVQQTVSQEGSGMEIW